MRGLFASADAIRHAQHAGRNTGTRPTEETCLASAGTPPIAHEARDDIPYGLIDLGPVHHCQIS